MTTDPLLDSINSWATERGLNFTAQSLPAPPPFLDAGIPGPGICLTIREPEPTGQPPAQLGIWLPSSEETGSYCMMRDADEEIDLMQENWRSFSNCNIYGEETRCQGEEAVRRNLNSVLWRFSLDYVWGPALQSWMDRKGLKSAEWSPTVIGGDAIEADIANWYNLEFEEPWENYQYPNTVAVSGGGDVTILFNNYDEELDCWDIDISASGLKAAADLHAWLDANIVLDQDDKKYG